jgi:SAM-dependent methyltransferase
MTIPERILLFLSRNTNQRDFNFKKIEFVPENSLVLLESEFKELDKIIRGKKVLDFGCWKGHQSLTLVERYNCQVVGVDINEVALEQAIGRARETQIPSEILNYSTIITESMRDSFDVVISHNSFEHFSDPEAALNDMKSLITQTGKIIITFGPPWLAPYGAHMHFFTKVPWVHLFFSEKTVLNVRRHFRKNTEMSYEEAGMNRMTISKFENIVNVSGLQIDFKRYSCIKKLNFLSNVPVIREFVINHVSVLISKS